MQNTTGILLVNLGTPDSPRPKDVFRYLNEFLTDGRVIDTPWLSRQLLVRGLIVPSRYRQSARLYQSIWTEEGSPLKVYGRRVEEALQKHFGKEFCVKLAMRYQNPSLPEVLEGLKEVSHLVVLPFFPQYASATTGSVHQKVMEVVSGWDRIPKITFINHYFRHPAMIKAFCAVAQPYSLENYDHVLFSFHGLPQRQVCKADPGAHCLKKEDCCRKLSKANQECYSAQCYATAYALVEALGLREEQYSIAFQSRLGKEPWLQPYASEVIAELARQGKKRVLVFCPSFVCDCLETISEIGVEYDAEFKHAGGESLTLVPGLNDHPEWIRALAKIVGEHIEVNAKVCF